MREIFNDYTFQIVALGAIILGILSGSLGSYTVLRRQSLLGDGVAHASLPGVVLGFLLTGNKNLEVLLLGALCTGAISALFIQAIVRYSKIKLDSALAMILSIFFGAGLVLLTITQKLPNANQAGLDKFIYGQASTMLVRDVKIISTIAIIFIIITILLWKEFKLVIFDREYAYTIGYPVDLIDGLLTFMLVVTIVIGLQSAGVVLMSAMMIAPAVASNQWNHKLSNVMILAGIFGAISALLGTYISACNTNMPTGPTIVMCSSAIALLSIAIHMLRGKKPTTNQNIKEAKGGRA